MVWRIGHDKYNVRPFCIGYQVMVCRVPKNQAKPLLSSFLAVARRLRGYYTRKQHKPR